MKTCNCINEIDDKFREDNVKIVGYAFMMPRFVPKITIATDWVDKSKAPRGKRKCAPQIVATFCPFCGVKYEEHSDAPANLQPSTCTL